MKTKRFTLDKWFLTKAFVPSFMLFSFLAVSAQEYPAEDIENLEVVTGSKWKVETDLNVYSQLWVDRDYVVASINPFFVGSTYIMTATDDRDYAKDGLASFTLKSAADVYIGHSQGIKTKPNWFNAEYDKCPGGEEEGGDFNIITDNSETLWFWKKTFEAGSTVSVGKNGGNRAMYVIILKPAGSTLVNNPTLADEIKVLGNTIVSPVTGTFTVYSVSGAIVLNVENVDRIDAELPAGIYALQFTGVDGSRASKKFMIQ